MKADPILNKAALLAKKRFYEEALKILKEEEDRYYGSFKYYYLYAVISLYSGSFAEAHEYFNLARKIKIKDPQTMLGQAVLYLRRMNTGQAVEYYLNVQEMEPKNRIAKKALAVIRKYSASEALSDWLSFDRLKKLFPAIPSAGIETKKAVNTIIVLSLVLLVSYGVLTIINILPNPFRNRNQRPAADFILTPQERGNPVQVDGFYRYILTRDEAVSLYDNALNLFTSYRDEAAKININRILESNASEGLKNRARHILDNMEVPGFDNFNRRDNPSYSDVKDETIIYRDVHVIWRGMATNVEITNEYTRFDFLVGYDTRRTLEGIVPVIFYSPVAINIERPLEVLGRIRLMPTYSEIMLEGVAIHQSGRLEN
ncbi:MAG: tetratricopeptide repeat protein [Treponema sp.]|nr:tetratricopeptide repeat protein [Treponema sp.]